MATEGKKAVIRYLLNEQGRKASILAGGSGQMVQEVKADLTPDVLELASVDVNGNVGLDLTNELCLDLRVVQLSCAPGWRWHEERRRVQFDAPQTAEALLAWEKARRKRMGASKNDPANAALIQQLEKEHNERDEKEKAERAAREAEQKARREALEADQKRREDEKASWIEAHSSDYLRRAHKLGYDCQRLYVTERAATELPGYVVDFDEKATWRSRACPSPEALTEVERLIAAGHQAECVWLTAPPDDDDLDGFPEPPFEPREAIVITGYLGKYDLIRYDV